MRIVHAIFENGVFKPTERVDLPDRCTVEFEPRVVNGSRTNGEAMDAVRATLALRFQSGEHDVAEKHNEHQP